MTGDRFKHTSRPVPEWPPTIHGYVHLLSVTHRGTETAYYCPAEEARAVVDLLSPHIERVEDMLITGATMEHVVDLIQREQETRVTPA